MSALLEQDQNSKIVEVVSAEGQSHNVSVNIAKHSGLLSRLIDDDNQNEQFISLPPLSNVNSAILSKVIEFLEHYNMEPMNEIEKPLKSANIGDVVQDYYANFIGGLHQEDLFELILAANYMDIKPLLSLTCATVASQIKGKSPEDIRRIFNIVNDFTPEEQAAVEAENRWCEEA
eukprot:gene32520-42130_t